MKCIDVKENLDAFADGESEISQVREIEKHLGNCAACQAEFKNLQAIRGSFKQTLRVSAPAFLDERVMSEFQAFHNEKRTRNVEETRNKKIGWFGIPRFAFAAAIVLFALAAISAFQIGKMSAGEISIVMPQVEEKKTSQASELAGNHPTETAKPVQIKIVEVPVVQEKIIKVPVIREKIVTKTVYVDKSKEYESRSNVPAKNSFTLKNSVKDNGYLTQTDLKGFQPVSEFKLRVSKEENENEK